MRLLGGVVLSVLVTPVPGFIVSPCSSTFEAARWQRHPLTPAADVHPANFVILSHRTRRATTAVAPGTRRARGKRLRSALGETPADVTAPTCPASVPGDCNAAAPRPGEDWSTGGSAAEGMQGGGSNSTPPSVAPSSPSPLLALALLNAVTLLWGTQHAVIKLILQGDLSPGVTNFARFGIAALLFAPWTPGVLRNPPSLPFSPVDAEEVSGEGLGDGGGGGGGGRGSAATTWRAGAELGVWMFLGFAFQTIGLGFTSASRSAFLLYLNVKLVPFFAFLLEGRSISSATWISAFLAFVGTVLLSSDGTPPNVGDLWSVLAAATSAMFILRLGKYSGSCDASQLNSANLWITAGLCGLWAAWEGATQGVDLDAALEGVREQGVAIGYLAVVTTALTNWMQALGQRSVPAERAAIIYAMDPVYAAGFAYLLLGESLGPAGFAGAGIITGAALWSQQQQTASGAGGDILKDADI